MCKKDNSICFAFGILAGIVGGIAEIGRAHV